MTDGIADVCPVRMTDGRLIETNQFLLLEDDQNIWYPSNLAPVIRMYFLGENTEIETVLNELNMRIDKESIIGNFMRL